MQDFRKLKVWEKAHEFALSVYRANGAFPDDERFGLTSQMRRSAASVPTNIAEGCGRESNADLGRFLTIAMGSASEIQYQLLLTRDLGYLPAEIFTPLDQEIQEIRKMLHSLIKRVRTAD